MNQHLRDRFFQRYGHELTPEILREVVTLALAAPALRPDHIFPGREHVEVVWRGQRLRFVWFRARRFILTFLPPADRGARIAWCAPKSKRRRR